MYNSRVSLARLFRLLLWQSLPHDAVDHLAGNVRERNQNKPVCLGDMLHHAIWIYFQVGLGNQI